MWVLSVLNLVQEMLFIYQMIKDIEVYERLGATNIEVFNYMNDFVLSVLNLLREMLFIY